MSSRNLTNKGHTHHSQKQTVVENYTRASIKSLFNEALRGKQSPQAGQTQNHHP